MNILELGFEDGTIDRAISLNRLLLSNRIIDFLGSDILVHSKKSLKNPDFIKFVEDEIKDVDLGFDEGQERNTFEVLINKIDLIINNQKYKKSEIVFNKSNEISDEKSQSRLESLNQIIASYQQQTTSNYSYSKIIDKKDVEQSNKDDKDDVTLKTLSQKKGYHLDTSYKKNNYKDNTHLDLDKSFERNLKSYGKDLDSNSQNIYSKEKFNKNHEKKYDKDLNRNIDKNYEEKSSESFNERWLEESNSIHLKSKIFYLKDDSSHKLLQEEENQLQLPRQNKFRDDNPIESTQTKDVIIILIFQKETQTKYKKEKDYSNSNKKITEINLDLNLDNSKNETKLRSNKKKKNKRTKSNGSHFKKKINKNNFNENEKSLELKFESSDYFENKKNIKYVTKRLRKGIFNKIHKLEIQNKNLSSKVQSLEKTVNNLVENESIGRISIKNINKNIKAPLKSSIIYKHVFKNKLRKNRRKKKELSKVYKKCKQKSLKSSKKNSKKSTMKNSLRNSCFYQSQTDGFNSNVILPKDYKNQQKNKSPKYALNSSQRLSGLISSRNLAKSKSKKGINLSTPKLISNFVKKRYKSKDNSIRDFSYKRYRRRNINLNFNILSENNTVTLENSNYYNHKKAIIRNLSGKNSVTTKRRSINKFFKK